MKTSFISQTFRHQCLSSVNLYDSHFLHVSSHLLSVSFHQNPLHLFVLHTFPTIPSNPTAAISILVIPSLCTSHIFHHSKAQHYSTTLPLSPLYYAIRYCVILVVSFVWWSMVTGRETCCSKSTALLLVITTDLPSVPVGIWAPVVRRTFECLCVCVPQRFRWMSILGVQQVPPKQRLWKHPRIISMHLLQWVYQQWLSLH